MAASGSSRCRGKADVKGRAGVETAVPDAGVTCMMPKPRPAVRADRRQTWTR